MTKGHCARPCTMDKERSVLALPRRNCDVGTPEEQLDRYGVYCQNRCTSCDNRHYCHICGERYRMKCMMEWAQMPYRKDWKSGEVAECPRCCKEIAEGGSAQDGGKTAASGERRGGEP